MQLCGVVRITLCGKLQAWPLCASINILTYSQLDKVGSHCQFCQSFHSAIIRHHSVIVSSLTVHVAMIMYCPVQMGYI